MSSTTSRPKVLVTNPSFLPELLEPLRRRYDVEVFSEVIKDRSEFLQRVKGASAIMMIPGDGKIDEEVVSATGQSLKVVSSGSVGYDHIDVEAMKKAGVKVGLAMGVLQVGAAEHTIGLTLMTLMRVKEHIRVVERDGWESGIKGKVFYPEMGYGLAGKVVGLVGLGGIGVQVAKRLVPFDVKDILYSSRSEKREVAEQVGAKFVSFDDLISKSDVVIIVCALNETTKDLFNKEVFARMKSSASIINVARGGIIVQEDLIEALKTGQIRSAGLDVTNPEPLPANHPLLALPNVTITPHMAASATEVRIDVANLTVNNIIAALEGEKMPSQKI